MPAYLTEAEVAYIRRRAQMISFWPYVGGAMLVVLAILAAWLFLQHPMLINPMIAAETVSGEDADLKTLALLAVLTPVLTLTTLTLAVALVLFSFAAFNNERRHIALVYKLLLGSVHEQPRQD